MQDKKLLILTEGGKEFGFGHITRCLSIIQYFKIYKFEIEFIVNGDDSVDSLLENENYKIINWLEDENILIKVKNTTFVLIDSLLISNKYLLKLEKLDILIIYIDDEKRRNILNKGFVLDWTVLSYEKKYFLPKKKKVTYLLGSEYTPLRPEFRDQEENKISSKIQNILVTFGGADVKNMTPTILRLLTKKFPNIQKNILIGRGFNNIEEIKMLKDKNTNLIFNASTIQIVELMQQNDIAIASGGQTLYELAYIGLPTIAILLVENARDDTEGWSNVGSLKNIGWYNSRDLESKLFNAIEELKDKKIRVRMQENRKSYISSSGAKLIVDRIVGKL